MDPQHPVIAALRRGEVVVLDDPALLPQIAPELRGLLLTAVETIYSFPLLFQSDLIGALSIGVAGDETLAAEQIVIVREVANQLSIAFQQAHLWDQVQRNALELEQRVQDRTAELQLANERLAALSAVKDEFVSNVSHELRTPITTLKLYHGMMARNPQLVAQYLAPLERETERLESIVENLLYLSRLDQDRVPLNAVLTDLNALADIYLADRRLLTESQGLTLTLEKDPALAPVQADVQQLGQALSVLLTNALNYTPPGGQVTIATRRQRQDGQSWSIISISDTGPGIAPDEVAHLFKRFFRGLAGHESGASGTGLGLSIAKEIVERHDGRLEVVSAGIAGKGATFSIWLPAAA